MRRRLTVAGAGFAAALGATSCESVIGVDFSTQRLETCDNAQPPSPPDAGDTGGGTAPLVAALYSVDWGDDDDPATGQPHALSIGFDLDGRCTSLFDAPICEPAPWTGARMVDGPQGIDNAVGLMLHDQDKVFGSKVFTSSYFTQNAQQGTAPSPVMLRVTDYSGLAFDGQVTVEWLVPSLPPSPPRWDGMDVLPVAAGSADLDSAGGGPVSHYIDRAAYVTGYHLVAHFASGAPIGLATVPIPTRDAELSADLVPVAGHWELHNGRIAGRVTVAALFDNLSALSISIVGPSNAICQNTPGIYPLLKKWLCGHTDAMLGHGPACDALSFGLSFETRPAVVGALTQASPPATYCPAGQDPASDTCDTP
jgi:hypothetical protein